jgi:hypothetical protein
MGSRPRRIHDVRMSIVVWVMIGIAVWHFCVLVPDRFYGGIMGAFIGATAGALASGYLLPVPGVPTDNPPGVGEALWALPGTFAFLAALYAYGARRDRREGIER